MVSLEQLRMPQPMCGEGVAERTFYIINIGQKELILERVTLDEEDNEQELFLDLGDDWTNEFGPILAGAESVEVKLLWRPIDSLADVASIKLVADRGFGNVALYNFIKETLNFEYIIRFRGDIQVESEQLEQRQARQWTGKNGRMRVLRSAYVTAKRPHVPVVVCVRSKEMKDT